MSLGFNFVAISRTVDVKIPITDIDLQHSERISAALVIRRSNDQGKTDGFDEPRYLSDICEDYVYRRALYQ
jgi:hypothetical protein